MSNQKDVPEPDADIRAAWEFLRDHATPLEPSEDPAIVQLMKATCKAISAEYLGYKPIEESKPEKE